MGILYRKTGITSLQTFSSLLLNMLAGEAISTEVESFLPAVNGPYRDDLAVLYKGALLGQVDYCNGNIYSEFTM